MVDSRAESAPPELPEGYYVRNVEVVLATVVDRYDDLLSVTERAFVEAFGGASEDAKRLYVRLISRKGPWFRRDRLAYAEIGDLDAAIDELADRALLDRQPEARDGASAESVLGVLLRDELVELLGELSERPVPRTIRRPDALAALLDAVDEATLIEAVCSRTGGLVEPLGGNELLVLRLLFFGNLYQDWTEFILRDLGVQRYEEYSLRRDLRRFESREMVDHSLVLRSSKRAVYEWLQAGELAAAVELAEEVRSKLDRWHPRTRRHAESILARVGRELERHDRLDEALGLYAEAESPPARERRCRVLDRLGRQNEALDLTRTIAEDPLDETEAAFAPAFGHRLERKLGLTDRPWRRPRRPRLDLDLPASAAGAVERGALDALAAEGRRGIFAENWLWRSLFGLAFWDIVFAPVPGAFHHPFQLGPIDLNTPDFRRARREAIDQRLEALRSESDLGGRLDPVYRSKFGIANALVAWHPEAEASLQLAFELVGGEALAIVSARLARDLKRYRRGLPDLLVEQPNSPVGFELLEVKAPGDQLRPEQGAWIDHLNAEGIPASVLHIRWAD